MFYVEFHNKLILYIKVSLTSSTAAQQNVYFGIARMCSLTDKFKGVFMLYFKFFIPVVIPKSLPVLSTESILRKMDVDRELRLSTGP